MAYDRWPAFNQCGLQGLGRRHHPGARPDGATARQKAMNRRGPAVLVGVLACFGSARDGAAADRLYPSGPPNGVAYLRFVDLAPHAVTITSPAAKIVVPADGEHRVGAFDPVTPGVALTGSAQLGEASKPINVTLAPNEFVTVAVVPDGEDGISV